MMPKILFEDDHILVCYKPAGFSVQTRRLGQQDMETWLKNYRAKKKEVPYIAVIHRLDQPVEGLMVFGKNQKAAASLSAQVQKRSIGKHYLAVGSPKDEQSMLTFPKEGIRTDYLTFDQRSNLGKVTTANDPAAKKAELSYRIKRMSEKGVCFDIHLHTGRHHQIRLQLMQAGFPLVGDTKYGGPAGAQLALCAYRLEFSHPVTGESLSYTVSPENPVFQGFVE